MRQTWRVQMVRMQASAPSWHTSCSRSTGICKAQQELGTTGTAKDVGALHILCNPCKAEQTSSALWQSLTAGDSSSAARDCTMGTSMPSVAAITSTLAEGCMTR